MCSYLNINHSIETHHITHQLLCITQSVLSLPCPTFNLIPTSPNSLWWKNLIVQFITWLLRLAISLAAYLHVYKYLGGQPANI